MSQPKEVKDVPCWRYKRNDAGELISQLCETEEEKARYEAAGFIDTIPREPETEPAPAPDPEPEPAGDNITIDIDGDGKPDIIIPKKTKKKPGRPAKKKKG